MLRIDETDEDVDFRPRNPAEERRYDPRGVIGDGESEFRLLEWPVFSARG